MTTSPIVAAAGAEDTEQLCGLLAELFERQHEGRPDLFREPQPQDSQERTQLAEYVAEILADADQELLAARDGAEILGLVHVRLRVVEESLGVPYRRAAHEAWIQHIVVGRSARRRGVGRALDGAARAWAKERGASSIGLQVWGFNEGARAFFVELGYLDRAAQLYVEELAEP